MKIRRISKAGKEPVYNMVVDEFHNYMIHGGIILKNCDALRYYCISRTMPTQAPTEEYARDEFDDYEEDYEDAMTGGDATASYIAY